MQWESQATHKFQHAKYLMLVEEITQPSVIEKRIIDAYKKNQWAPMPLDEAKNKHVPPPMAKPPAVEVEFLISPLFVETYKQKVQGNPVVAQKFAEFKASKAHNPIQKFGAKDYPIPQGRPLSRDVPGLQHAHLTHDLSLFYSVEGRNPTKIKLYGIFGHDEAGTGQPANVNRQKSTAKQMGNQPF